MQSRPWAAMVRAARLPLERSRILRVGGLQVGAASGRDAWCHSGSAQAPPGQGRGSSVKKTCQTAPRCGERGPRGCNRPRARPPEGRPRFRLRLPDLSRRATALAVRDGLKSDPTLIQSKQLGLKEQAKARPNDKSAPSAGCDKRQVETRFPKLACPLAALGP